MSTPWIEIRRDGAVVIQRPLGRGRTVIGGPQAPGVDLALPGLPPEPLVALVSDADGTAVQITGRVPARASGSVLRPGDGVALAAGAAVQIAGIELTVTAGRPRYRPGRVTLAIVIAVCVLLAFAAARHRHRTAPSPAAAVAQELRVDRRPGGAAALTRAGLIAERAGACERSAALYRAALASPTRTPALQAVASAGLQRCRPRSNKRR